MSARLVLFFLSFCSATNLLGQESLRTKIGAIAESISGDVGVAVRLIERGDTLTYHGKHPFPMQSVYKFPLALQVMNDVDNGKITLDKKLSISKSDYYETHSPLMNEHPEGSMDLTVADVLRYTIEWSDNIGCDALFKVVGDPKRVDLFVNAQGIRDMAIRSTEKQMHANDQLQYQNWSTPVAMEQLLTKFFSSDMLSDRSRAVLWEMMVNAKTGPKRIRGLLPVGTVVADKTGTGSKTKDRRISAVNDVGIVVLPNNEHLAIVVYITNTHEEITEAEDVIARISSAIFDHYSKRN